MADRARVELLAQRAEVRSRDSPARVSSNAVSHLSRYSEAVQTLGVPTFSGHFVKLGSSSQVFGYPLAILQKAPESNGTVGVVGSGALLSEQQGSGSISSNAYAMQVRTTNKT